ncbi:MAG: glycosyltransferase [Synergistetes bacterium]|nr:MAG: Glycosyl transferase group 1 [bacterium 42_11]MBC7331496.1 glycosyltransferase [Synergistota bacterium]MDK2871160.1 polysaccharide biosynthesis protein PslH [bacterium]
MKCLWVAPYLFYPLRSGGQFSIYPWLKELANRGWEFTLIQYNSPYGLLQESLKELTWARKVFTVEPNRFSSRKEYFNKLISSDKSFFRLRNDVREIYGFLEEISSGGFNPRVVILSHSYLGFLIPHIKVSFPEAKILLDLHNLEWRAYLNILDICEDFWEKLDAVINFVRLRDEESKALESCDGVVYLSPVEGKYAELFGKPLLWRPARFPENLILSPDILLRNKDFLITTSLNIRWICSELLRFIKNVWVKYKSIFEDANFWILGREPLDWFKEEASKFKGVHILGWVEDPSPYVLRSRIFVAPFKKSMGSLTKVISAWSWGIPVVTTPIVAKGLKGTPGKHFLVGGSDEELLSFCLKIAQDDFVALKLSQESRRFVIEEYDLSRFVDRFEKWLEEHFLYI